MADIPGIWQLRKPRKSAYPVYAGSARWSGKLPEGVSGEASGGTGIRGAAGSFPRGSDGSGRNKRKAEQNRRWKQRVGRTCAGAETAGTLYGYLASDWRTAAPGDAGSPRRNDADD